MPYPFVPNTLIPGFIALSAHHGISFDRVSRRAGLLPQLLTDPQAVLTVSQLDALIVAMQDELGDPAFALHMGEFLRTDLLQLVGSLVVTAPTPREAFAQFVHFKNLIHPVGKLLLRDNDTTADIVYRESSHEGVSGQFHYAEMYMAAFISIARTLIRRDILVHRVALTHDASDYRHELKRLFLTDHIQFNAEENTLTFDRHLLDEPLSGHFPEYHQQIKQLAAQRLAALPVGAAASTSVMSFLEAHIGNHTIGMEDVAKHLGITLRTLQRRLKNENTTYAALRDGVRYRHAQQYLQNPDMDMEQIATALGFSETANFYPAFKRWSGMAPGEFRRRHTSKPDPS